MSVFTDSAAEATVTRLVAAMHEALCSRGPHRWSKYSDPICVRAAAIAERHMPNPIPPRFGR